MSPVTAVGRRRQARRCAGRSPSSRPAGRTSSTGAATSCGPCAPSFRQRRPRLVLFVARGTSDNAALYGNYLVQTCLGIPAASASPSVVSLYSAQLDLRDVLVVAVSQSGESPDLVTFLEMARPAAPRRSP